MTMQWTTAILLLGVGFWAPAEESVQAAAGNRGAVTALRSKWPRHVLKASGIWQLNPPLGERFDASGLALSPPGALLTVHDRGAEVYRIDFTAGEESAKLMRLPDWFAPEELEPFAGEKVDRYDIEGIAFDEQGRMYLCEEANRWVLRCDPAGGKVERLDIDWDPVGKYFDAADRNASFEGVAVGGGRLYVVNERQMGRIIVVDLKTLRVVDSFAVRPSTSNARDLHYSDLSFFEGVLYVLLRESRCVLAVAPADQRVLAEYDFREMERGPEVIYKAVFPTGQMEGLAVDSETIWLVTDNNGAPRGRFPADTRPTLFRCRREPLPGARDRATTPR